MRRTLLLSFGAGVGQAQAHDLVAERTEVRDAAPAIGDHHRQIAEHPPRWVRAAPLTRMRQTVLQRAREADLVGQ
jgi:hypothetical protein